jgi:hypothetical protein
MDWNTFRLSEYTPPHRVGLGDVLYFVSPDSLHWVGVRRETLSCVEWAVFYIIYQHNTNEVYHTYAAVTEDMRNHFLPMAQALLL